MGGEWWRGTGRNGERGNHNRDMLCEKKMLFSIKREKKSLFLLHVHLCTCRQNCTGTHTFTNTYTQHTLKFTAYNKKKISFKFLYNFPPPLQSSLHKPFELKEKEKSNLSPDLLQEFLVTWEYNSCLCLSHSDREWELLGGTLSLLLLLGESWTRRVFTNFVE